MLSLYLSKCRLVSGIEKAKSMNETSLTHPIVLFGMTSQLCMYTMRESLVFSFASHPTRNCFLQLMFYEPRFRSKGEERQNFT